MFKTLFALFALVAVAFAAPSPNPAVAYSAGVPLAYSSGLAYSAPLAYGAPVAYGAAPVAYSSLGYPSSVAYVG